MYVKPAQGRQVPDPFQRDNLPPEGREVEANQYWLRRKEDGDVTEDQPPVKPVSKPASSQQKEIRDGKTE